MIRALLAIVLLTACSCSTEPIASSSQATMEALRDAYDAATVAEHSYDQLPACSSARQTNCYDDATSERVHHAHYDAAAALASADEERTAAAMAKARQAIKQFVDATGELQ